jgi:hypothetical protein
VNTQRPQQRLTDGLPEQFPIRVEMFRLQVDLSKEEPFLKNTSMVSRIEASLHQQLPGCEQLLRWALVEVIDTSVAWCEGAYCRRYLV